MGAGNGGAVKASRVLLLARLASGGLLTVPRRPSGGTRACCAPVRGSTCCMR